MVYSLTSEDLILVMGGHAKAGLGSQRHLPIFRDENGIEYVSLNGQILTPLSNVKTDQHTRREVVQRG